MATKANHHFIPQFYLRGFAEGIGRQARLFTFDRETKRSFTTKVRNVGSTRYFNRVEADGIHPDAVEDGYAEIEAGISTHLVEVIDAQAFPSGKHFNSIINLVANVSVRNPRFRENISGFLEDVAKQVLNVSLSSEEIWSSQLRQMKQNGVPLRVRPRSHRSLASRRRSIMTEAA